MRAVSCKALFGGVPMNRDAAPRYHIPPLRGSLSSTSQLQRDDLC